MDLIELATEELFVGMSLRYTLRDSNGSILLAKGQKIDSSHQLAGGFKSEVQPMDYAVVAAP